VREGVGVFIFVEFEIMIERIIVGIRSGNLFSPNAQAEAHTRQDQTMDAVWIDTHYNSSDVEFANRAGESVNLAVNTVANVLHTFYSGVVIPEFPSSSILTAISLMLVLSVVVFARNHLHKKA